MQKVAEEQNNINLRTQKLNLELYEIQAEVKKLSKVGFGCLRIIWWLLWLGF